MYYILNAINKHDVSADWRRLGDTQLLGEDLTSRQGSIILHVTHESLAVLQRPFVANRRKRLVCVVLSFVLELLSKVRKNYLDVTSLQKSDN